MTFYSPFHFLVNSHIHSKKVLNEKAAHVQLLFVAPLFLAYFLLSPFSSPSIFCIEKCERNLTIRNVYLSRYYIFSEKGKNSFSYLWMYLLLHRVFEITLLLWSLSAPFHIPDINLRRWIMLWICYKKDENVESEKDEKVHDPLLLTIHGQTDSFLFS